MKFLEQAALWFTFAVAVFGCTLPAADTKQGDKYNQLETLYGFEVTSEGMALKVISTGCTKPQNFYSEWRRTTEGYDISFIRRTPDRCRRAPVVETILIPLDQTRKNDHLRVLNPIKAEF